MKSKSLKKILLVEDEEELLRVMKETLTDCGYTVETAKNGKEASDILTRERFDLLLTDLAIPKIDGFHLAKICKKKYPEMNIIFITGFGYNFEQQIRTSIREGICYCCLYKPFSFDYLKKIVNLALK